jgi:predicted lysophospholipase L1 biosynthesis ABC-type transport system permease subunit
MLWPGQDPIGRRFTIGMRVGTGAGSPRERVGGTVVGVVRDVRGDAVRSDPRPEAYFSTMQFPINAQSFAVQAEATPALARAIRAEVAALDPEIPVYEERTLESLVADAVAEPRLYSLLFAAFAGTALLLAAVGVYGVVSLAVGQRTREFGVRVALGARAADVARLVLRQALAPVAGGIVLGMLTGLAFTRALGALLYDVRATDPGTFALAGVVLAVAATAAVLAPARRATSVAPKVVLHDE